MDRTSLGSGPVLCRCSLRGSAAKGSGAEFQVPMVLATLQGAVSSIFRFFVWNFSIFLVLQGSQCFDSLLLVLGLT